MKNFLCSVAVACAALAASDPAASDFLMTHITMVDVETGTLTRGQSVLIAGNRIAEIGTTISAPEGTPEFDANGAYLIPGLWDAHVHIFSSPTEPDTALPLYLINGVTGIRDMGALWPIKEQLALQAQIEAGEPLGPRLVLSGAWVDASPGSWPGMFLADTPQAARAVVARIAAEGWAAVKAYSMLDKPTYLALAEAAHDAGLPFVGHIPERVALGSALAAGQNGIEHFGRVTMACSTSEAQMLDALRDVMDTGADRDKIFAVMAARNRIILESWNKDLCNQVLASMATAHMHVSPTLVVAGFYVGDRPADDTPRVRMLPPKVRAAWSGPDFRLDAMTDEVRALASDTIALTQRTFLMAHWAGVPILASTDASFANPWLFHGFSLLDELDLYVKIGLTPREALYTAIVAPPRFFGLPDQDGTIAPERRADLVLLDANPLEDLATLRQPRAVIIGGRVLDRQSLEDMEAQLLKRGE